MCRSFTNGPAQGISKAELRKRAKSATAKTELHDAIHGFEKVLDESGSKNIDKSDPRIVVPEWLQAVEESGYVDREVLPVWWPRAALDRENVPYNEDDLKYHKGRKIKGRVCSEMRSMVR